MGSRARRPGLPIGPSRSSSWRVIAVPESKAQKALRAVLEGRVRIVKASDRGIALHFRSEHPDRYTLQAKTYSVAVWRDEAGVVRRRCGCENAQVHPTHPRCSHVWLAEHLWRPNEDGSGLR